MNKITFTKSLLLSFAAIVLSALITSCNSEDDLTEYDSILNSNKEQKKQMRLIGDVPSFSINGTRATDGTSESTAWPDGAVVLLRFCNTEGKPYVSGKAHYKASDKSWTLSYYGTLIEGVVLKCYAYYFEGLELADNYSAFPNPFTPIYVTESASYCVSNDEIEVNATLQPMTSRVSFKGKSNSTITVKGLSVCTKFSLDTGFEYQDDYFDVAITPSGSSSYIYGRTSENCKDTIYLINEGYEYKKHFDSKKFAAGESGYITIPSQEINKGWKSHISQFVSLGLSVKWAQSNIGSSDVSAPGTVCSWGDAYGTNTSSSSSYNSSVNNIAGDVNYDIATRTLGSRWHIPTKAEWTELFDNCTLTRETVDGVTGVRATAKNGNSIFLPAYGYTSGSYTTVSTNSYGLYWSSTGYGSSTGRAYHTEIYVGSSSPYNSWNYDDKYYKMCIRPVFK